MALFIAPDKFQSCLFQVKHFYSLAPNLKRPDTFRGLACVDQAKGHSFKVMTPISGACGEQLTISLKPAHTRLRPAR